MATLTQHQIFDLRGIGFSRLSGGWQAIIADDRHADAQTAAVGSGVQRERLDAKGRIGCRNVRRKFISCGSVASRARFCRNSVNDPFVREVTFETLITVSSAPVASVRT